ncbi:MAG: hypothetical protein ABI868_10040 [Acidobacteriota bacterium]
MKYRLTIAAWCSSLFEKALVRRVKRRIDIRIVRFCSLDAKAECRELSMMAEGERPIAKERRGGSGCGCDSQYRAAISLA